LDSTGIEYYEIGCCSEPGQVVEAVSDAFAVGCKL